MFFKESENKLGKDAKLGVEFYLLNPQGEMLTETGYNQNVKLPMASTKKIAIALTVFKKILFDQTIELTTKITIFNSHFSPGRPTNTLDQYFFKPEEMTSEKTVKELLTYMLTESDNTSTDVLLEFVGGPAAVNQLIKDLNIPGHHLTFSSKELLAEYFGFSVEKSPINISEVLKELPFAYSLHSAEKSMVKSESDMCTPKMMADLLKLLIKEHSKKESWLGRAADLIFDIMQYCSTGDTLIKKGVSNLMPFASAFGSKQGGLGGIRNDTAFIHFHDGRWAILSIHTCLSSLPLASRDEIIANLAKSILIKHVDFPAEESVRSNLATLS